jgi:hypothetical protein
VSYEAKNLIKNLKALPQSAKRNCPKNLKEKSLKNQLPQGPQIVNSIEKKTGHFLFSQFGPPSRPPLTKIKILRRTIEIMNS